MNRSRTFALLLASAISWGCSKVDGGSGTRLSFPSLTTVGGVLGVMGTRALTTLSLPALTTVVERLELGFTALANPSFPSLTTVPGTMIFRDSPQLTQVDLPALTSAGGLEITTSPGFASLGAPSLRTATGPVRLDGTALTALTLPALVAADPSGACP
jgi:hypothetical protein